MSDTELRITPREMRMMAERILSLTDLPKGIFMLLPDHVMFSQALGLGGFAMLESGFETLKAANLGKISIVAEDGSDLTLSGGGQHAWGVAFSVIDLLGELVAKHSTASVTLNDVAEPAELAIIAPLARRSGLEVEIVDGSVFTARPLTLKGDVAHDEPLLWSLLTDGTSIEADLWWRIYALAKKALAEDTVVSRRHAGPMIVNDDGTVIGRKDNDDETDISFLASGAKPAAHSGDAQP